MKKILMLVVGLAMFIGVSAQISQLVGVSAKTYGAGYPLEEKEYEYTVNMSGSGSATFISLSCKNGIFTSNKSSTYNSSAISSFSVKIKWGDAGYGEIYVIDSNSGVSITYPVNIEKPSISISGPTTVKYNDYAEYKISANPNITISALTWNSSSDFESVSGENGGSYKVKLINNTFKTVNNAISVLAKTDYGDLSTALSVKLEPTIVITPNNAIICNNSNITYSLTPISGASIIWYAGDNMTLISGQGLDAAIFKGYGNGYGTVKAVVTLNGKEYTVENSSVWVGSPSASALGQIYSLNGLKDGDTTTSDNFYPDFVVYPNVDKDTQIERYKWVVNGVASYQTSNYFSFHVPRLTSGKTYNISVTPINNCGLGKEVTFTFSVTKNPDGGGQVILSAPIDLLENKTLFNNENKATSVKIYNLKGVEVYKEDNIINFNIQNTSLKSGIYIIETIDQDGNVTRDKVSKTNR